MLTRAGSPRTNVVATRMLVAALLSVALSSTGDSVSVSRAAESPEGPFEYRIPAPGDTRQGNVRRGNLGTPGGTTEADPDEFSVNNVGLRNPNVQIGPVGGGTTAARGAAPVHATVLHWLRLWFMAFLGR